MNSDGFPHLSQTCWCASCDIDAMASLPLGDFRRVMRRMNICPDCGDKRCQKAGFHGCGCSANKASTSSDGASSTGTKGDSR